MREDHIEIIEKIFPDGCVIVHCKPDHPSGMDCFGMVVLNPKHKAMLMTIHILIEDLMKIISAILHSKGDDDGTYKEGT